MVRAGGSRLTTKIEYTLEDFKPYFHIPLKEAGKQLGMSLSQIKDRCRKIDLLNWPFRKLEKLQKSISALEEQCQKRCIDESRKRQCTHSGKIAELKVLMQEVIDNPNDMKEILPAGNSTSSSVVTGSDPTRKALDDSFVSKDPFIRQLQTKSSRSGGAKRKRAASHVRNVPSLPEFLNELIQEDSLQMQVQGRPSSSLAGAGSVFNNPPQGFRGPASPRAPNAPLSTTVQPFKNILRRGWYFSDNETVADDGGLEYPGTVEAPVVVEHDPLGRAQRRLFATPVVLPELKWTGEPPSELVMLEPRFSDLGGLGGDLRLALVPTFLK